MTTVPHPELPITRMVAVDDIPAEGMVVAVEATATEREALAALNDLVALSALRGEVRLRPEPGGGIRVTGTVSATLTQTCVVSLDAFDAAMSEPVDVLFLAPAALAAFRAEHDRGGVMLDDPDDVEEPDLIEHGRIDVGALVAEHLTLGLDPYPRKPGAALAVTAVVDEPPPSPFAVLRRDQDGRS